MHYRSKVKTVFRKKRGKAKAGPIVKNAGAKKLPALGRCGEKTTDMKWLFKIPHARFEEPLVLYAGHVAADIGAPALRVAHLAEHAAVR